MSKTLIGESSWDSECFNLCLGPLQYTYLHNDFFSGSNKGNTRKINRVKAIFKGLFLSFKAVLRKDELYYSSLNFEVLVVAYLMSWYKRAYVFLPNTIGLPSFYSKTFNTVMKSYKSRIYVSDTISKSTLESLSICDSKKIFDFKVPDYNNIKSIKYIVAFPAALSHKATSKKSEHFYDFSQKIVDKLAGYGLDVYILPHPRDREYIENDFPSRKTITSDAIRKFGDNVCYISACSSLSLNKRYGGGFGCWVSIDGKDSLPDSLKCKKKELIDISYFENV